MFDKIKARLNYDLLELIRRDREGEYIIGSDIVTAINSYGMLTNLGVTDLVVILGSVRASKPIKVYQRGRFHRRFHVLTMKQISRNPT